MAEIEYPGIAKLVSRLVWDQETVRSSRTTRTKIPLKSLIMYNNLRKLKKA